MNNIDVVLYHGTGCPDGATAAWVVSKHYPDAEYIGVKHGKTFPENLERKDVLIVDFCYPREEMIELKEITNSLLCLDHHISAYKECSDLEFCYFDMERSGAGIAWDHFNPNTARPWIVDYIEYRDLGHMWNRPKSEHPYMLEEVLAAVDSYEKSFEQWNQFAETNLEDLVAEGKAILRYKKQLIERICKNAHPLNIRGKTALAVNSNLFQSEVGNYLTRQTEAELGLVWYQNREGVKFSLRSIDSKVDVSEIAKTYHRGGGHRNAAGFSLGEVNIQQLVDEDT